MKIRLTTSRPVLLAVAAVCTLVICVSRSSGQESGNLLVNQQNEQISKLLPYIEPRLPSGRTPYSAVVIVSGCSGFQNERFRRSYERDINHLVGLGYAVFRTDYVRAHGLENSCVGAQNPTGQTVSVVEIARYVQATVAYLDLRDDVDPERIYLLGSSLGGGGVLTAMSDRDWTRREHIAGVINYFPVCRGITPWTANAPMLLLLGELDNIQPARYCLELVENSPHRNLVQAFTYPQAHHCFNAEDTPRVTEARPEPTCAYNPEASIASWQEVQRFLNEH